METIGKVTESGENRTETTVDNRENDGDDKQTVKSVEQLLQQIRQQQEAQRHHLAEEEMHVREAKKHADQAKSAAETIETLKAEMHSLMDQAVAKNDHGNKKATNTTIPNDANSRDGGVGNEIGVWKNDIEDEENGSLSADGRRRARAETNESTNSNKKARRSSKNSTKHITEKDWNRLCHIFCHEWEGSQRDFLRSDVSGKEVKLDSSSEKAFSFKLKKYREGLEEAKREKLARRPGLRYGLTVRDMDNAARKSSTVSPTPRVTKDSSDQRGDELIPSEIPRRGEDQSHEDFNRSLTKEHWLELCRRFDQEYKGTQADFLRCQLSGDVVYEQYAQRKFSEHWTSYVRQYGVRDAGKRSTITERKVRAGQASMAKVGFNDKGKSRSKTEPDSQNNKSTKNLRSTQVAGQVSQEKWDSLCRVYENEYNGTEESFLRLSLSLTDNGVMYSDPIAREFRAQLQNYRQNQAAKMSNRNIAGGNKPAALEQNHGFTESKNKKEGTDAIDGRTLNFEGTDTIAGTANEILAVTSTTTIRDGKSNQPGNGELVTKEILAATTTT